MKETGIIRRVDDLGRIVIPREVRNTLKIKESDPLEIWIDKDSICLKKYNALISLEESLKVVVDVLNDEDVSHKISNEDKALVKAMVNMLLAKWKESEDTE